VHLWHVPEKKKIRIDRKIKRQTGCMPECALLGLSRRLLWLCSYKSIFGGKSQERVDNIPLRL